VADAHTARRLAERTLELVDIPSVSREEAAIARHVRELLPPSLERWHDGEESIVVATARVPRRPLVVLAGHLDTVPVQDNLPGRIAGGAVHGLGATDMKGGLAVMLELAAWLERDEPERALDVAFLFFPREELPVTESPVPGIFAACPALREADLAVVLEPTDNAIQAGCVGNMNATVTFRGKAAHSARPWLGLNAIRLAIEGLDPITQLPAMPVDCDGLTFHEVVTVTGIEGGVADNVVPDTVRARLNFRFAPGRTLDEASYRLRELVGDGLELEITSASPAARVAISSPIVQRLRDAGSFRVEPKQAWTPVAQFSEEGVDAVNLGPGGTAWAHTREEQVEIAQLLVTYEALQRFIRL
jgi:succinyl-diaminopimelate desuccinylase